MNNWPISGNFERPYCRLCSTSADVAPVGAGCVVVPDVEAAGAWVVVVVVAIV